jgi:hypothetical protein
MVQSLLLQSLDEWLRFHRCFIQRGLAHVHAQILLLRSNSLCTRTILLIAVLSRQMGCTLACITTSWQALVTSSFLTLWIVSSHLVKPPPPTNGGPRPRWLVSNFLNQNPILGSLGCKRLNKGLFFFCEHTQHKVDYANPMTMFTPKHESKTTSK